MSNSGFNWNKILQQGGNQESSATQTVPPPAAEQAAPDVMPTAPPPAAPAVTPPPTEPPVSPVASNAPEAAAPPPVVENTSPPVVPPTASFDEFQDAPIAFGTQDSDPPVANSPATQEEGGKDELKEILNRIKETEQKIETMNPKAQETTTEREPEAVAPTSRLGDIKVDPEPATAPPVNFLQPGPAEPPAANTTFTSAAQTQLPKADLTNAFEEEEITFDAPSPKEPAPTSDATSRYERVEDPVSPPPLHSPSPDSAPPTFGDPFDDEPPASPAAKTVIGYEHVTEPEAPPAFNVPVVPPPTFSTPEEEMSALKRAATDSGMPSVKDLHIDEILRLAVERKASDIHLTSGVPPMARVDGDIVPLPWGPVSPEECRRLIYEILNDDQLEKFERTHELDFAHTVPGIARFRFNVYMQRGSVAGAMRAIPNKIPEFETLGLPNIIRDMSKRTSGLVLVTGPTGSGKSTTIATMVDDINKDRKGHIVTIEDPIEYLHQHRSCIVNQREMHSDTYSFHNSLRAVLRQDPDIILVGELRDLETIEAALTLAETGHLVFGTLHTRNAPSTIDRIIDVFPKDAQAQIRVLLSNTLEGVVSQQLLPKLGGGRRAAIEIMIATPAIKNLIREGKTHQMYSSIETSGNMGMQTMDAALAELYRSGQCDYEECMMRSIDKETFARLAKRV